MITTALSGRLNDGTNERTAAMAVGGGAPLFPPCITDSNLCSFSGAPALLYLQLLLSPLSFVSHQGYTAHLAKCKRCPRNAMTITSGAPHRSHCLLPATVLLFSGRLSCLVPPFFHPPLLVPRGCHSRSRPLILHVPPSNSCWCLLITVTVMWTDSELFPAAPCKCGSLRWREGQG